MRKSCSCLSDGTPRSRTWGRAPCTCWPLPKCRIWCCASPTDNSLQFIELKQFPLSNELHRNTGQLPLNLESTTWNVKYLLEIWSPFGLAKKLIPFEFRHLNTFDKSFNLFRIRFNVSSHIRRIPLPHRYPQWIPPPQNFCSRRCPFGRRWCGPGRPRGPHLSRGLWHPHPTRSN